ncbi:MAG: type II secretion system F family protein [Alphaproteobacteria bacterium]|nr:type II secretion system F family protein [Alphaproteobacteria bacterium]
MNLAAITSDLGLLTATVFLGMGVLLLMLLYATAGKDATRARNLNRRVSALRQRGQNPAAAAARATSIKKVEARSDIPGLEELARKFVPKRAILTERLARTGKSIALGTFALVCISTGAMVAGLLLVLFKFSLAICILGGIAVGIGLPHLVVGRMIAKRTRDFLAVFPEAIELIVRGIKSGLPVTEEIAIVGREMVDPVGHEFRRISDALRFGQNLDEALWDAARRLNIPDFNFFVISLSVQRETGGNLAETLENLAEILRRRRQMKLKIRAISSEARASGYIIGSLPFAVGCILFLIAPSYVTMLFTDPRGLAIVGAGLTLQAIGGLVMAKMVRFEI